jgi:hypothetical protein
MTIPNKTDFKPRDNAKIIFKSSPGSTVFMLGVDRSVNILKKGNNIEIARVMNDLREYNAYKNYGKLDISGTYADDDRYNDFGDYNAIILTNAYNGSASCDKERSGGIVLDANQAEDSDLDPTFSTMENFESITRTDFPETWLFHYIKTNRDGVADYNKLLPDTITNWDLSAFALSKTNGLAIAKPQSLLVFSSFFVKLNLPYSIRVGEILKVEVLVFNYFTSKVGTVNVDVTLFSIFADETENNSETKIEETLEVCDEEDEDDADACAERRRELAESDSFNIPTKAEEKLNEKSFDFYDASKSTGSCKYTKSSASNVKGSETKRIRVESNSGTAAAFFIKATKAGFIKVKVRAEVIKEQGKPVYDEVIKSMRVKYEGLKNYKNKAILVDLSKQGFDSSHFDITTAEQVVTNSIRIDASVIGDLVGTVVDSPEKLM